MVFPCCRRRACPPMGLFLCFFTAHLNSTLDRETAGRSVSCRPFVGRRRCIFFGCSFSKLRRSAYSPPRLPFCFKQIIGQGGSADGSLLPAPWQYRGMMEPLLSLHPIWQVSLLIAMMPFADLRRSAYSPPLLPFCFKRIMGQGGSADGTVLPAPWHFKAMEPLPSLHPIW